MKPGKPLTRLTPMRRTPFAGGSRVSRPRTSLGVGKSRRKREADAKLARLRPLAVVRAQGHCELCDRVLPLDLHHRLRRGPVQREQLSNYFMCCRSDHSKIHDQPNWAKVNGWICQDHQSPTSTPVLYRGSWVLLGDNGEVEPQ